MDGSRIHFDPAHSLKTLEPPLSAGPPLTDLPGYQRFCAFPGINLITLTLPGGSNFSTNFIKEDQVFEFGYIFNGIARTFLHESPATTIELTPKSATAHYIPSTPATFEVTPKPDIQMLGVEVKFEVMRQMLKGQEDACPKLARVIESGEQTRFFESTGSRGPQIAVASQILSCPLTGLTRCLFLQSKVLEFLSFQLEAIKDNGTAQRQGLLTRNEEQRIRDARLFLRNRMTEPPTLVELADLTGLNLTKLKKGFKLVFGKTAYACLHQDRMERAHALLSRGHMNVSQVAWEVGYINVSHFSAAFRKQYGVRPKSFQMAGI